MSALDVLVERFPFDFLGPIDVMLIELEMNPSLDADDVAATVAAEMTADAECGVEPMSFVEAGR